MGMVKLGKDARESHLSREVWADAALAAIARGGVDSVAVEPIASLLGVTKGSFYWHFKNRSELVEAALHRWEHNATVVVIAALESNTDPSDRLKDLLTYTLGSLSSKQNENAIFGAVNDPIVLTVVERVSAARQAFLERIFVQLGHRPAAARMRARIAYATYLGHLTLQMTDPLAASVGYIDELVAVLTAE
jgi:AcrR family transcriptional regulator